MNMNLNVNYLVMHEYDTDGGYGDAVRCADPVALFYTKEEALKYVKKYSDPQIYDTPYCELENGVLSIVEIPIYGPECDAPAIAYSRNNGYHSEVKDISDNELASYRFPNQKDGHSCRNCEWCDSTSEGFVCLIDNSCKDIDAIAYENECPEYTKRRLT